MRTNYPKYVIFLFILVLFTWTLSCSGRPEKSKVEEVPPVPVSSDEPAVKYIRKVIPEENTGFRLNEQVNVILELQNANRLPDSVQISFDGKSIITLTSGPWEYSVPAVHTMTTGRKSLKITAFKDGRSRDIITRFMIIYSDIVPARQHYKVVNTYPHSTDAFTQGLIYDHGSLYEGTGQEAGSSLREVELKTGKILRQHNLDASLFGEGITLYQDRIYQVTWTNKVGFIYEKSTFRVINRIYYTSQGWGLTTINDKIVMSDGTNVLYFFEPEMFTVVSRIEVYDNEKKVDSLNELEYINGEIWANVWMTDLIARIDPASGKVIAYIDLTGLLPQSERRADTDVLNGIAWDREGNRIFVTGKRWPELYEITVTE
jgi:glutamine cyclotransferase